MWTSCFFHLVRALGLGGTNGCTAGGTRNLKSKAHLHRTYTPNFGDQQVTLVEAAARALTHDCRNVRSDNFMVKLAGIVTSLKRQV